MRERTIYTKDLTVSKWCIDFGFEPLNIAEFNEKMINEGFDPKSRDRTSRGRLSSWRGIKDHGSINIDTN